MTDETTGEAPEGADASPEVEPQADAEVETTESEADSPPAGKGADEKPKSDPFDERIGKLTKRFRDAERENQSLQQKIGELQKQLSERPEPTEQLKTLADFEYDEGKFLTYLRDHVTQQAEKAATKVAEGFESKTREARLKAEFEKKEDSFSENVKDYRKVVYESEWDASPAMAQAIRMSDVGPDLAYHLAKNPDIASEIAILSDVEAVRRMTLIEVELQQARKAAEKKVSGAPPPPPKLPAGDPGIEKDPADMTDAEFAKWRRRQIAQRQ